MKFRSFYPPQRTLMGPGPSDVNPRVLAAMARPTIGHLDPAFVTMMEEIKALLEEYASELRNTEQWKTDAKGAMEALHHEWTQSFANDKGQFTLYTPVGCDVCSGTGYKGRVGLHELLLGSDTVKRHIQEHARVAEILATALHEGMRTLKQDGMEKCLTGMTDLKEVRSVCIK